jgi:hypothetical protein
MYRAPAARSDAPPEFTYAPDSRANESSAAVMFQLFSLPLLAGVIAAVAIGPNSALVAIAATAALILWRRRSRRKKGGAILRIEAREVVVLTRDGSKERTRASLSNLLDVSLDTKTIRMVEEGGSAIPAMRFADSRVGPELDKARIVLTFEGGRRLPLTDEHGAHMETTEQLGKMRVFLRAHGWIPEDEREEADEEREGL